MKKITRLIITIAVIIALVIIFYYLSKSISAVTGKSIAGWASKMFK